MIANGNGRITTALLLAAGTGSRLQPLTDDAPKCLTEINGTTILERLIRGLRAWEFQRLIIVVGHLDDCIRDFLNHLAPGLSVEYVFSNKYRTTNNIYSLWAARHAIREPFLLLESDLIFDDVLLRGMLQPNKMAVSHVLPWMNGTTVAVDRAQRVTRFHLDRERILGEPTLKTVNMYSFSLPSWRRVARRLNEHISAGRVHGYYETVFAEMVADGSLSFQANFFDQRRWYELDTLEDLY